MDVDGIVFNKFNGDMVRWLALWVFTSQKYGSIPTISTNYDS